MQHFASSRKKMLYGIGTVSKPEELVRKFDFKYAFQLMKYQIPLLNDDWPTFEKLVVSCSLV